MTGSAKSVALAVVLQMLPQFFVAPAAGVINDRMSRKRVMILADLARAVIVLLMLVVRSRELVGLIYVLLFLETTMWAFFEPARNAVIPNITRGNELLVANALSSTTWSVILAVGFAIGGVVAVPGWAQHGLRGQRAVLPGLGEPDSRHAVRRAARGRGSTLEGRDLADFSPLVEGLRYVASDRRLLAMLLVKAGLGVMGTNWVILPILGERTFPVSCGLGSAPRRHAGNEHLDGRARGRRAAGPPHRRPLGGAE